MNYQAKGTVHAILDDQVYSETFAKREFILAVVDGDYTELVKFQLINDRRGQLSNVTEGDVVTVNFNVKGREHVKNGERQYYTNLDAWKIDH